MGTQEDNKAVVGRWFTEFWGPDVNLAVVDEIAAPDMLLQYSLHEPRRGRDDIKAFMRDFRAAFPRSELPGHGGADRRGRPGRRPVGRRRHSYRAGLRRLPGRPPAGRDRPPDALHRHHGADGDRRPDREGDRPRRRRHRADPAGADQGRLTGSRTARAGRSGRRGPAATTPPIPPGTAAGRHRGWQSPCRPSARPSWCCCRPWRTGYRPTRGSTCFRRDWR